MSKKEAIIAIKMIPKASRSEVVGWEESRLKIRIAEVPEKGRANKELIRLLSEVLKISKSEIEIISGETSRLKRVKITGLTEEEIHTIIKGSSS